jgi:prevent-host-death family protein
MKTIQFAQDVQPVSAFRSQAASFIAQVHQTKRPLIITQNGKSAAVLLDVAVYDAMMEKLELLQDVETASAQVAEGKGIYQAEARRQMKSRYSK